MSHIRSIGRNLARAAKPATAAMIVLLLACLGLAACGGSSKRSSASASAAAATSNGAGGSSGPAGPGAGRFQAVRACLQKNGITLPRRTPGAPRVPGAGGFLGGAGGPQLPSGVTRAQYEAALKKCGAGGFGAARTRLKNPAYRQALAKFATCMRENGVNVPQPNTSGTGPVFDIKGLNTASPQFKTAETKCSGDLRGSARPTPGAAAGTGGGA